MTTAELTNGEARAVYSWLSAANFEDIRKEDVVSALINALSRIHSLERRVDKMERQIENPGHFCKTMGESS